MEKSYATVLYGEKIKVTIKEIKLRNGKVAEVVTIGNSIMLFEPIEDAIEAQKAMKNPTFEIFAVMDN